MSVVRGAALLLASLGMLLPWQERLTLEPILTDASRLHRDWTLDGSAQWAMRDGLLVLTQAGVPSGAVRRPAGLAVLDSPAFGEVALDLDLKSTAPMPDETPRRDVVLVVGYQSPTRFYYAHISAARDAVHNGIFVVNDADRRRIDEHSAVAPLTDQAWHHVRLTRQPTTGRIDVYFDDADTPFMSATDKTLLSGRIGMGSFDDTAEFRQVRVSGVTN